MATDNRVIEVLRDEIARARHAGDVVLRVLSRANNDDVRAAADSAVAQAGGRPFQIAWREIDRSTAEIVIEALLKRDLAYRVPCMDDAQARSLSERVIALVPAEARFLTNGGLGLWHAAVTTEAGWDPVTEATFDVAIVGIGQE